MNSTKNVSNNGVRGGEVRYICVVGVQRALWELAVLLRELCCRQGQRFGGLATCVHQCVLEMPHAHSWVTR